MRMMSGSSGLFCLLRHVSNALAEISEQSLTLSNNIVNLFNLVAVTVIQRRLGLKLFLEICNLCVPGGKLRRGIHVCGWISELKFEGIRCSGVGKSGFGSYRDPRKVIEGDLNVFVVCDQHSKSAESPKYTVRVP
jgi:hypothetical protein